MTFITRSRRRKTVDAARAGREKADDVRIFHESKDIGERAGLGLIKFIV